MFRKLNLVIIVLMFVGYAILFGRPESLEVNGFEFLYIMSPIVITTICCLRWKSVASQIVITIALLAYLIWFIYLYVDAIYIHPDWFSELGYLFAGISASPVLALLWLTGLILEIRRKKSLR